MKNLDKRAPISNAVEAKVLVACRRKCCLCYYLHGKAAVQKGQIAHLRRNRSDSSFEDLVYLCLEHHDEFDTRTSQSKGLTPEEVLVYRDRLYREMNSARPKVKNSVAVTGTVPNSVDQLPPPLRRVIRRAKGRFDYLLTPWRLTAWSDVKSFLFAFKASNRIDGICRIERIFLRDGRVAIICTQIPGNPGNSITNSVEAIAFQVCAQFTIHPSKVVWIEHYKYDSDPLGKWSLVEFGSRPPRSMFANPSWRIMTREDWRALGLRPR